MNYKYIIFDIDNTLIDFEKSYRKACECILSYGGCEITAESIERYNRINDECWFSLDLDNIHNPYIVANYHRLYQAYLENTMRTAIKELGLKGDFNALLNYSNKILGEVAVINPHVMEVIEKLYHNQVLCIATNGLTSVQPNKAKHFEKYISHIFISEQLGYMKPQKEFFDAILARLGCNATDCLMVGDSLLNDIGGANNAGIDTCFYNPKKITNSTNIIPKLAINDFLELLDIV